VTRAPATEAIVRIEVAEYVPTAMAKDDRGARPTLAVRLIDAHRSAIFLRHAVLCARDVVEIVDRKPAGIDRCAGFLGSHGFEGGKPSSAHHAATPSSKKQTVVERRSRFAPSGHVSDSADGENNRCSNIPHHRHSADSRRAPT
jgi:hypothetical protein